MAEHISQMKWQPFIDEPFRMYKKLVEVLAVCDIQCQKIGQLWEWHGGNEIEVARQLFKPTKVQIIAEYPADSEHLTQALEDLESFEPSDEQIRMVQDIWKARQAVTVDPDNMAALRRLI